MKIRCLLIFLVLVSVVLSSCNVHDSKKIAIYLDYDAEKNQLANEVEAIPVMKTVYVLFQNNESFKNAAISLNVSKIERDYKQLIASYSLSIDSNESEVIIPIKIDKAGAFELSFYTTDADSPIYTKNVFVE